MNKDDRIGSQVLNPATICQVGSHTVDALGSNRPNSNRPPSDEPISDGPISDGPTSNQLSSNLLSSESLVDGQKEGALKPQATHKAQRCCRWGRAVLVLVTVLAGLGVLGF